MGLTRRERVALDNLEELLALREEAKRQRALLRGVWVRLEQGFLLRDMLGRDLADRLRSEFEGEDPYAHVDSGF